ncbi:5-hydroxytryptamine (serotonin) receptor 1A [Carabus blaptoides fortunei]
METLNTFKSGQGEGVDTPGHANDVIQPAQTVAYTENTDLYQQFSSPNPWIQGSIDSFLNLSTWNSSWADNDTLLGGNSTGGGNGTGATGEEPYSDMIFMGVTSVFLGLMILITVIGNVFVIAAILLERNLQNVANYLIVSLAVADLMVACLVMPLGAVYEISRGWILGPELCDMWTSSDVLCCTASILHLVAIAVDRYWAVTNVDYIHTRNSNRIGIMIVVVWTVALIVSLAPQFGWKDPDYLDRINIQQQCLVSQDIAYQIFATCSTFYIPLLVILVLYWKIFQTARKRIRRRQEQRSTTLVKASRTNNNGSCSHGAKSRRFLTKRRFLRMKKCSSKSSSAAEALVASLVMVEGQSTTTSIDVLEEQTEESSNEKQPQDAEATTAFTITKSELHQVTISNNVSPEKSSTTNNGSASHQSHISDISRVEILAKEPAPIQEGPTNLDRQHIPSRREKRETLEAKRERKAAKTLAIITGAFVVCWLPFFIMALLMPLCESCEIKPYIASFFLWLGYFNSTLNPVIYTIFSPEFRQAFKRILCGGHRRGARNFRSAKLR